MSTEKTTLIKSTPYYDIINVYGEEQICTRNSPNSDIRVAIYRDLAEVWDQGMASNFRNRYPTSFLASFYEERDKKNDEDGETGIIHLKEAGEDGVALLAYLKDINEEMIASFEDRLTRGVITLSDLPRYFSIGKEVVIGNGPDRIAGTITHSFIEQAWYGPVFITHLEVFHGISGRIDKGIYVHKMRGSMKNYNISTLEIKLITEDEKKALSFRGSTLKEFNAPGKYLHCEGNLVQTSWFSTRILRAKGRVVVDPVSFARLAPDGWREAIASLNLKDLDDRDESTMAGADTTDFNEENHWACYPYLLGFSLKIKEWGRLSIDELSNIDFRDDAFNQLVLDPEIKELIYSLVKFHGGGFTDIIEGKGGGCIFLLHGKPGLGKTASAEAVAEILHRPLYSVSVGELGTDIDKLEDSLRNILEVATIWNAVILLDEADIFLEARDQHDIERNAMVGVFLRLLEYHDGVMFLTTNRVKDLDRAFYSRISVALHFKENNAEVRGKIWRNLLKAAGMSPVWADSVKEYDINGRQIKNAIRLAQTLAKAGNRSVEVADLKRSIDVSLKFADEMSSLKDNLEVEA